MNLQFVGVSLESADACLIICVTRGKRIFYGESYQKIKSISLIQFYSQAELIYSIGGKLHALSNRHLEFNDIWEASDLDSVVFVVIEQAV